MRPVLMLLALLAMTAPSVLAVGGADQGALTAFWNSLTSKGNLNWNVNVDFCLQTGVECDSSQRVTTLVVENQGLTGTLPTQLGSLAHLQFFFAGENYLSGTIPTQLGNLAQLQILDLHSNRFTGNVPYQLRNIASLNVLFATENCFSQPLYDYHTFSHFYTDYSLYSQTVNCGVSYCQGETYGLAIWPTTAFGLNATGECVPDCGGTLGPIRKCRPDGTWDPVIYNQCTHTYCQPTVFADKGVQFYLTGANRTVYGTCLPGKTPTNPNPNKNPYATCSLFGHWEQITYPCV